MTDVWQAYLPGLTQAQYEAFTLYYRMLIEANAVMNLTAITAPEDVAVKHFADSLSALAYLPEGASVVDVGTGAGFPAVPLLIMRPSLKMTLLDALKKRLTFVEGVLAALGLSARTAHLRAEDAGRDRAYRETFDFAVARAVAPLPVLLEYTVPLLKTGGTAILYKGDCTEELRASAHAETELRCTLCPVPVPSAAGARTLILAKKTAPTPARYPRKAGTPAKLPL